MKRSGNGDAHSYGIGLPRRVRGSGHYDWHGCAGGTTGRHSQPSHPRHQLGRELGLEWVYRLLQEPRRMWRRYLVGNVLFLYRVGRERLGMALPHHIAVKLSGEQT